jgi:hypothetical protein
MKCLAMQFGVVVSLDRSGDRVATANTITWRGRGRGVKVKILVWGLSLAQCLWCRHLSWSPLAPFPLGIWLHVEVTRGSYTWNLHVESWHKRVTLLGNAAPLCPGMARMSVRHWSHDPP